MTTPPAPAYSVEECIAQLEERDATALERAVLCHLRAARTQEQLAQHREWTRQGLEEIRSLASGINETQELRRKLADAQSALLAVAEALGRYHDTDTERFPASREVLVGRIAEIRAEAWEEGWNAGRDDGNEEARWHMEQSEADSELHIPAPTENPYRPKP